MQSVRVAVVQVPRRFVGQQKRRIHGQRAGNCRSLLLSTGKLRRTMVHAPAQPHPGEQFLGPPPTRRQVAPGNSRRHHHVLQRRKLAQEMMKLKDEAHFLVPNDCQLFVRAPFERLAVHHHAPRRWTVQRSENMQQRALPRAARSHHGNHLSARDRELDSVENVQNPPVAPTERLHNSLGNQDRHAWQLQRCFAKRKCAHADTGSQPARTGSQVARRGSRSPNG